MNRAAVIEQLKQTRETLNQLLVLQGSPPPAALGYGQVAVRAGCTYFKLAQATGQSASKRAFPQAG